jgi:hypothetical protein
MSSEMTNIKVPESMDWKLLRENASTNEEERDGVAEDC